MGKKLEQEQKLPKLTLNMVDGRTLTLPDDIPSRYLFLSFFRGVWCGFCRSHLTSHTEKLEQIKELGGSMIVVSVDTKEAIEKMVEENGFTMDFAYGVTEEQLAEFDPFFGVRPTGERYVQPMEFLVHQDGTLFGTVYASGPVGRMGPDEVVRSLQNRERRRLEAEAKAS